MPLVHSAPISLYLNKYYMRLFGSDDVMYSSMGDSSTGNLSYTLLKSVIVPNQVVGGSCSISFGLEDTASLGAGGRIYRNGVGVGTPRTSVGGKNSFIETITSFVGGDVMAIYGYAGDSGVTCTVDDFTVSFTPVAQLRVQWS